MGYSSRAWFRGDKEVCGAKHVCVPYNMHCRNNTTAKTVVGDVAMLWWLRRVLRGSESESRFKLAIVFSECELEGVQLVIFAVEGWP